jgi:tyramine---L-glutamate ligase
MTQRIFVFEFITGGGLADAPLPPSLAHEGALMLDALLRDARDLAAAQVSVLRDARLPALVGNSLAQHRVTSHADCLRAFDAQVAAADAVLVVAPETGGVLADLSARVEAAGRLLLGCDAASCRSAASKSATGALLAAAGIDVLPHYRDAAQLPDIAGRWVVKPDDGAGCDGLRLCDDRAAAAVALRAAGPGCIAQPWLAGEARSMNLMCARGAAALLSVNRQHLLLARERVALAALGVGDVADHDGTHARLAARIAAAMPGLLGHVGVDLVHTARGPVVVEINPRMSSSACALRDTLGYNVLAATLDAARGGAPAPAPAPGRTRRIELAAQTEVA